MFLRRIKFDVLTFSFGGLILLLLIAAIFMHRSINQASEAERREKQEQLELGMRHSSNDFAALLRDVPDFNSEAKSPAQLEAWISEQYTRWRNKTLHPQLIRGIGAGRMFTAVEIGFSHLELSAERGHTLTKSDWPAVYAPFKTELITRAKNKTLQPLPTEASAQFQIGSEIFLVQPLTASITQQFPAPFIPPPRRQNLPDFTRPPGDRFPNGDPPPFMRHRWEERKKRFEEHQQHLAAELQKERRDAERSVKAAQQALRKGRPRIDQLAGFTFLTLDTDYLQKTFLPQLMAQHFNTAELANYYVAIIAEPERQIFFTNNADRDFSHYDAQAVLFQSETKAWRGNAPPVTPQKLLLLARHKSGSLQSVVNRTRWRNLMIGYGVLLALFVSAVTLMIATARARALAQKQIEFVAGVTHELRTPLTAIQSAGFNLASGRVNEAERVKQYGTMIHTEGRRLADLIDQVLSYARIETNKKSGENLYNFQLLQVASIIEQALSEYEPMFTAAGWQVEKSIATDLPPIFGDANVLAGALKNLLQNALKYAEQGKWLRVAASHVNNEVQITVADHGSGIERRDLPHIFEPFYRAQKMVASTVPGTGLGLSLVNEYMKAHHGRVTVDSVVGEGTVFTLHLPINATNGKSA